MSNGTQHAVRIRLTYRRNVANVQGGWKVTKYDTGLPF
jgi:hypothetical protein